MGTQRNLVPSDSANPDLLETLDASCTESPYLSPQIHRAKMHQDVEESRPIEMRSKAYQCAIINLSSNIPLPSAFYQNNHRRIYYDDQLQKHTQFKNEYIYAFTWEDPRIDHRLLKIRDDDVVLCITSAGDNVLDYLYNANPRQVHAVDLNPNQNHLLELKIAAFQSLPYAQVWQMFGEGRFASSLLDSCSSCIQFLPFNRFLEFREALVTKLSPHMSSQACQYWFNHGSTFSSRGLYETGGSRYVKP